MEGELLGGLCLESRAAPLRARRSLRCRPRQLVDADPAAHLAHRASDPPRLGAFAVLARGDPLALFKLIAVAARAVKVAEIAGVRHQRRVGNDPRQQREFRERDAPRGARIQRAPQGPRDLVVVFRAGEARRRRRGLDKKFKKWLKY